MNLEFIWSPLDDDAAAENAMSDELREEMDAWFAYASDRVEVLDLDDFAPFPDVDFDAPGLAA